MKKVYTAPEILFESFTMSTNIAAGCDKIVRTFDQGNCAYEGTGGIKVFTADLVGVCEYPINDDASGLSDGFCYHVPGEDNDLFAS